MKDKSERKPRVAAGTIAYDADAKTVEAFRAVASALLQLIELQAQPVRDLDPKGVHQMRIALRRLRAAIAIFATLVEGDQTALLKIELRWLTGRLGSARDLDVMQSSLKRVSAGRAADRAALLRKLSHKRKAAFETARKTISSARFRKLLLMIRHWIQNSHSTGHNALPPKLRNARRFAKTVLAKRGPKVMRRVKKLDRLTVKQRHRLRIAMKKLFYAIGFFDSLFTGDKERKRLASFSRRLKRLLDDLGALNDAAVQRELLARLGAPVGKTTIRPGAAAATPGPHNTARIERLLVTSAEDGRKLSRARPFWE